MGHWPKAFPWQLCAKAKAPQAKNAADGFFLLLNNCNNMFTATGVAPPLIWSYWHWISPGDGKTGGSGLWVSVWAVFCSSHRTAPGQRAGWEFWLKPPAVMWPMRADIWGQCSKQSVFKLQLQQCRWWKSTEHYTESRGRGLLCQNHPLQSICRARDTDLTASSSAHLQNSNVKTQSLPKDTF